MMQKVRYTCLLALLLGAAIEVLASQEPTEEIDINKAQMLQASPAENDELAKRLANLESRTVKKDEPSEKKPLTRSKEAPVTGKTYEARMEAYGGKLYNEKPAETLRAEKRHVGTKPARKSLDDAIAQLEPIAPTSPLKTPTSPLEKALSDFSRNLRLLSDALTQKKLPLKGIFVKLNSELKKIELYAKVNVKKSEIKKWNSQIFKNVFNYFQEIGKLTEQLAQESKNIKESRTKQELLAELTMLLKRIKNATTSLENDGRVKYFLDEKNDYLVKEEISELFDKQIPVIKQILNRIKETGRQGAEAYKDAQKINNLGRENYAPKGTMISKNDSQVVQKNYKQLIDYYRIMNNAALSIMFDMCSLIINTSPFVILGNSDENIWKKIKEANINLNDIEKTGQIANKFIEQSQNIERDLKIQTPFFIESLDKQIKEQTRALETAKFLFLPDTVNFTNLIDTVRDALDSFNEKDDATIQKLESDIEKFIKTIETMDEGQIGSQKQTILQLLKTTIKKLQKISLETLNMDSLDKLNNFAKSIDNFVNTFFKQYLGIEELKEFNNELNLFFKKISDSSKKISDSSKKRTDSIRRYRDIINLIKALNNKDDLALLKYYILNVSTEIEKEEIKKNIQTIKPEIKAITLKSIELLEQSTLKDSLNSNITIKKDMKKVITSLDTLYTKYAKSILSNDEQRYFEQTIQSLKDIINQKNK